MPVRELTIESSQAFGGITEKECQMIIGVVIPTPILKILLLDYDQFCEFIMNRVFGKAHAEFRNFIQEHNIAEYRLRAIGFKWDFHDPQEINDARAMEFEFVFRFIPLRINEREIF